MEIILQNAHKHTGKLKATKIYLCKYIFCCLYCCTTPFIYLFTHLLTFSSVVDTEGKLISHTLTQAIHQ